MQTSHLKALKNKRQKLEHDIHCEEGRVSRNDFLIKQMKKRKLHLKEEIARVERACG